MYVLSIHLVFNTRVGMAISNLNVRGFRCHSLLDIVAVQKLFAMLLDFENWYLFKYYFNLLS